MHWRLDQKATAVAAQSIPQNTPETQTENHGLKGRTNKKLTKGNLGNSFSGNDITDVPSVESAHSGRVGLGNLGPELARIGVNAFEHDVGLASARAKTLFSTTLRNDGGLGSAIEHEDASPLSPPSAILTSVVSTIESLATAKQAGNGRRQPEHRRSGVLQESGDAVAKAKPEYMCCDTHKLITCVCRGSSTRVESWKPKNVAPVSQGTPSRARRAVPRAAPTRAWSSTPNGQDGATLYPAAQQPPNPWV